MELTSGLYGKNIALIRFPATPLPMYKIAVRIGPSKRSKSVKNIC